MGPDGTYAFIDFRSVEEANNALILSGLKFRGHILKIQRPKNYTGAQPLSSDGFNLLFGNYANRNKQSRDIEVMIANIPTIERRVDLPSRIVLLEEIIKDVRLLQNDIDYSELY